MQTWLSRWRCHPPPNCVLPNCTRALTWAWTWIDVMASTPPVGEGEEEGMTAVERGVSIEGSYIFISYKHRRIRRQLLRVWVLFFFFQSARICTVESPGDSRIHLHKDLLLSDTPIPCLLQHVRGGLGAHPRAP